MRLLNTKTLGLTYFVGNAPEYAILSHRWEEEEILFEDVSKIPLSSTNNPARSKLGFAKVIGTCTLAANDGFEWVWIDSCCIDKSSSAELQESINSMFRWYNKAQVCYAYLSDVADEPSGWSKDFERSQWFTRGWTLQELLAPSNVEFYSADWSPIGTKLCRTELLASITSIETEALEFDWGAKDDSFCAAQKFSWAAHRQVSKAEDSAYCLFGLFNVNMPLLYGEGEEKAFLRLQQAILKETADHTLFLFAWAPRVYNVPMLANWITRFCRRPHCMVCRSHRECFPLSIPYSDVIRDPALSVSTEDAHYIRLVRQGVMVKLPLTEPNSPGIFNNVPGQWIQADGIVVAILPWFRRGHTNLLFGIVLRELSSNSYLRISNGPALLGRYVLTIAQNKQGAYTVYDSLTDNPSFSFLHYHSPPSASRMKIAHFEFSSQSFKPFNWRCEARNRVLVETAVKASFLWPEQQNDRYFLTMSFRNMVDQDMVGTITLWYSMSKIGLHKITLFQDQHCLGRWETDYTYQSRHYMSIVVPSGEDRHSLRVVLRRISITKHMYSSVFKAESFKSLTDGKFYQIAAAYRLYVTHVSKGSQRTITKSGPLPLVTDGTDSQSIDSID